MKGTIVDESQIRSPRLRQSEGKIIPAVSSFEVPIEEEVKPEPMTSSSGVSSQEFNISVGHAVEPEHESKPAPEISEAVKKLVFKKTE